jgi:creatinine amidohydrolase
VAFLNGMSAENGVSAEESGAHSGENETSMMLALEAGLVKTDCLAPGYLGPMGPAETKMVFEKGMPALTSNGVLGDPRKASAEKGEVYLDRWADLIVSKIGSDKAG